ncbi:hypothetical protein DYB32_003474 [Aphanomyces invadans]|uniref:Uncharacterized protein n=1 Tax=Aphanomyces invadans TaxID=157072 RepID=A0A418B0N2_9STRA|nr:hypothetical protein DYB32_003474 [Aphanomyces invadans]
MDQTGSCDDSSVFARPAEVVDDIAARASRAWTVPALDDKVFLHASMQLVQQQSETRQRVRNLWYLVQRLRWDGHMDASAMDMLRTDLVQVVKGLSLEKLDGSTVLNAIPLHAEWIDALTSVARSDLLAMQATVGAAASAGMSRHPPAFSQLTSVCRADEYKAAVAASSPVHVPLMWQRGVVEKAEKQAGLTRRDSKNLSMLQVFKDIARDKYVVDGVAVTSSDDVVHTLMAKIVPFLQQLPHLQPLSPRTSASPVARLARCRYSGTALNPLIRGQHSEATALSFVERVLRGSARTQSGGDIYDAVALVGGNPSLVTLCPVSHDVLPVMLTVDTTDQTVLHVYLQVCMQFKAMPHQQHHMPVSSPRAGSAFSGRPDVASPLHSPRAEAGDWAVFTGTLSRTFTFGAAADPGHVIVAVDPSPSYADDSN